MQRMKIFSIYVALIAVGVFTFLTGCNLNGDSGNNESTASINITGTASMLARSLARTTDPSTASAILPAWYYLGAWQFGDQVTPDASGHFTVGIPADSDRSMLLLVDTTQQRKIDQIVGYIAIGVDAYHNMLNFPVSEASGDIDLGTISKDTDSGQTDEVKSDESNIGTVETDFNLTFDELKQMASNDNMLRSIKNWYANNYGSYWYGLNPVYILTVSGGITAVKNLDKQPGDILTLANDIYYQLLWMSSNKADNPYSSEFTGSEISIYTPSNMTGTISVKDWDNGSHTSIGSGVRFSTNTSSNIGEARFWEGTEDSSSVGQFLGAVPDGQWVVKKDGVEIARYEFSQQNPITYQSDGTTADHFNVFVPVIRINTNSNDNIVVSIDIQWYLYDGSTYQTVDPTSKAFQNVVEYYEVALTDNGNPNTVTEMFEIGSSGGTVGGNLNITDTNIVPSEQTWTTNSSPTGSEVHLDSLVVQYGVYGTRFMFDYR